MKYAVVMIGMLTLAGCATNPAYVEAVAENQYRITVSGPLREGKTVLEQKIVAQASELCGPGQFHFDTFGKDQNITFSGRSPSNAHGGWHGNDTTVIQAVATIHCKAA